ncbi:MAG: SpoVA/SpoVAEb family sporulation membrane protein [Oscillospiraceae bacterium]|nr:SpoVA/SpoVAEb family sporulation membrane protein [Oscillospiraceae bacterium]
MTVSPDEYKKMGEKAIPKTKSARNLSGAFLIGGAICAIGQAVLNFYLSLGLSTPEASAACSITLIGFSAVLTGIGIYDKIAKFGGGGTLVPITGFANAVVSPAMEFKSEGFVLGLGVKIFSIAGPVIVYGVLASAAYGFVLWVIQKLPEGLF